MGLFNFSFKKAWFYSYSELLFVYVYMCVCVVWSCVQVHTCLYVYMLEAHIESLYLFFHIYFEEVSLTELRHHRSARMADQQTLEIFLSPPPTSLGLRSHAWFLYDHRRAKLRGKLTERQALMLAWWHFVSCISTWGLQAFCQWSHSIPTGG